MHPRLTEAQALIDAGRESEALPLIEEAAATGDSGALFALGDLHWRGVIAAFDPQRGRALFEAASDAGDPIARRAVTNLFASGIAGERDWPRALARLEEEARDDRLRARMLATIRAMDLTDDGDPRALPTPRQLSESPDIRLYPGLFSRDECGFLAMLAEPSYERSTVGEDSGAQVPDPIRTSDGATIHWLIEDPATHALNRRLAAASGTRHDQGEPLQILRYRPGQEYKRHLDWQPGAGNPRILTALVYLNQGYSGGETLFTRAGIQVRGRPGDGIVFRNSLPNGRADPMSEHAGLPVTAGAKLLASRWIRAANRLP